MYEVVKTLTLTEGDTAAELVTDRLAYGPAVAYADYLNRQRPAAELGSVVYRVIHVFTVD